MVIINNEEYYQNLIKNGFKKHTNKRDLTFLVSFWHKKGENIEEINEKLIDFCVKNDKNFIFSRWECFFKEILDKQLKSEYESKKVKIITFRENEISKIKSITDQNLQKVMFCLLCLAKMYNSDYIYFNSKSSILLKDVFELAKVNATQKQQEQSLHVFFKMGALDVCLKPILKCELKYIDASDIGGGDTLNPVVLEFEPYYEMILEWEKITNGIKTIRCEKCGAVIIKTNNKMKYCKDCAKEIKNEKTKKIMCEKRRKEIMTIKI